MTGAAGGAQVRVRLDLAYDGTEFSGWADQPSRRTVEGVLTDSLCRVLRLETPPRLVVAGRTDAGVHATGQVAHVDLPAGTDLDTLTRRLRRILPDDVVVRRVRRTTATFDARFSALARRYRYLVCDGVPDPRTRRFVLSWPRHLDVPKMQRAAAALVGEHDFAAYCKPRPGASTVRRLLALDVTRDLDQVRIDAVGQAFCHNQVRAIVGALLAVGEGRRPADWPAAVLAGGVRVSSVTVAPPHGLTLIGVDYPDT